MKLKDLIDNSNLEDVFQILLTRLNKHSKKESEYLIENVRQFFGAEIVAILIANPTPLAGFSISLIDSDDGPISYISNFDGQVQYLSEYESYDGLRDMPVSCESYKSARDISNEEFLAIILYDLSLLNDKL